MKNIRNYLFPLFVLTLSLILASWGYQGHYKISSSAALSFNQEMADFMEWSATLADHASDADDRKDVDPTEGPKHYIDIDNYPEFLMNGRIPQTMDSVVAKYGENFVIDQGILPWATVTAYDSLVQCFLRFDWYKAVLFAADLGHYVADGHMPLHITRNYNGQYSGNTGIHSRYESTMINTFISQINYEGDAISFIEDVNGYVFNYLYANYKYVDSVLLADDYAQAVAGNTSSYTYKESLWNKTKSFTIPLFSNASHALAELIYSAWAEAGKPPFNSNGIIDHQYQHSIILEQNHPNPFSGSTEIGLIMAADSQISLTIVDSSGVTVDKLIDGKLDRGKHTLQWDATGTPAGIYLLVLQNGTSRQVKRIVVSH